MTENKAMIVVIVDDDPMDVAYLSRALLKAHPRLEIIHIGDSTKAADVVQAVKPKLVIVDINMPIMDGFEVLRDVRRNSCGTYPPVVILSSSERYEDREESYRGLASAYLSKPTTLGGYVGLASSCSDFWFENVRGLDGQCAERSCTASPTADGRVNLKTLPSFPD